MKVFVVGASGATGKLVVLQLLQYKMAVRMVVREHAVLHPSMIDNPLVEIERGNIDSFSQEKVQGLLHDCDAAICCLGHTVNLKGIFGKPHKLVLHAVQKITAAMEALACYQKCILMSTTAYTNTKAGEKNGFREGVVFSILNVLLPPQRDNMLAGDYLVRHIGESKAFSWVAVRPDTLIDEESGSAYDVVPHPRQSPVFNAGKTNRINVASFMADLLFDEGLWKQWMYTTPVLYNKLG